MCSKQLVFLFDLNAYNDFITKPRENLNKKLLYLRLACLRILTEFSTKTSSLKWGFKFFDSSGPITQFMHKFCFSDVSLEAFETFESEITTRYERHISFSQALAESSQNHSNNGIDNGLLKSNSVTAPIKLLQLALTQLLCEFQWENMDLWSPSIRHKRRSSTSKRNFLFLISNLTGCDEELFKYFELNCLPEKRKFLNILLTQSLREQLLQKADIHWVWLNTSEEQFLETSSKFLSLLSNTLKSIHGSLIPLMVLSQSLFNKKYINGASVYDNEILPTLNQSMHFPNSLLPFSTLFQQSLYFPFYSKSHSICSTCIINIPDSHMQIPVQITKVVNEKELKSYAEAKHSNSSNNKFSENEKLSWKKFVIQCAVPKDIHYTVYDVFLCLASNSFKSTSVAENFASLNENLLHRNHLLVLDCVTEKGSRMVGLFAPLSHGCALISIVDILSCFKNKVNSNMSPNEYLQNYSDEICNFKEELKAYPNNASVENVSSFIPKAFQMESIEPWYKFKSSQSLSNLSSFCYSKSSSSTKMESFHKMLQHSVRNTNHLKTETPKCTVESVSDNPSKPENETDKEPEILSDLSLEEMLSVTKEIYSSTMTSNGSIIISARKIMKMIAHFFKNHGSASFEEEVHNCMKENFLMTARSITEKYEMFQDEEGINQKIREYQIQVLLILEMEALLLPPDRSNCVNMVTSFLRLMSFYCGASELNRLLVDIIRENYCHNLWDVLVEIGDELDIPIVGESDTSDSPDILSSELTNEGELFGSSSNISERSSSSACSRKENKKLVRLRSDISDTARSRQVLVPRSSPKKKKSKACGQKKAIRCSPRLASKKNNQTKESNENSHNVRRNLFPKDKSNLTPRKHKPGQAVTPKKRLKLKPVLETPSHKQDLSNSQRRKSSIRDKIAQNVFKEVAESPKISETAKGANKEILEKLHKIKRPSISPMKPKLFDSPVKPVKEVPGFQFFNQYTPDRNRRLSLKIFSKILCSPTARMGLKKCTKRLFDQISPQKCTENNKKLKLHDSNKIVVNSPEL